MFFSSSSSVARCRLAWFAMCQRHLCFYSDGSVSYTLEKWHRYINKSRWNWKVTLFRYAKVTCTLRLEKKYFQHKGVCGKKQTISDCLQSQLSTRFSSSSFKLNFRPWCIQCIYCMWTNSSRFIDRLNRHFVPGKKLFLFVSWIYLVGLRLSAFQIAFNDFPLRWEYYLSLIVHIIW